MHPQTFPTTPTEIKLADGKLRHLRYSLGSVKKIKEDWGKTFVEILGHPPEDFLPKVLMLGLVERDGLVEDMILNDQVDATGKVTQEALVIGPMIEYVQLRFVEAFFGEQQSHAIGALLERNRKLLAAKLDGQITALPPDPTIQ